MQCAISTALCTTATVIGPVSTRKFCSSTCGELFDAPHGQPRAFSVPSCSTAGSALEMKRVSRLPPSVTRPTNGAYPCRPAIQILLPAETQGDHGRQQGKWNRDHDNRGAPQVPQTK